MRLLFIFNITICFWNSVIAADNFRSGLVIALAGTSLPGPDVILGNFFYLSSSAVAVALDSSIFLFVSLTVFEIGLKKSDESYWKSCLATFSRKPDCFTFDCEFACLYENARYSSILTLLNINNFLKRSKDFQNKNINISIYVYRNDLFRVYTLKTYYKIWILFITNIIFFSHFLPINPKAFEVFDPSHGT